MDIHLIQSYKNAGMATGLTIVIDVLRACSTVCYAFSMGISKIYPVSQIEEAFQLKKELPDAYLMGERDRKKVEGCDFGNSPSELLSHDLKNKVLIMTTSAGTQGITQAKNATEILTGAFVNANAVISYIRKKNPSEVSFVITDDRYAGNEDALFAQYCKESLSGLTPNFNEMYASLLQNPGSNDFIAHPVFSNARADFDYCMKLDAFSFIVKADREDNRLVLKKYE